MSHVGKGFVVGDQLTWDGEKPIWGLGTTPLTIMGADAVAWWRADRDIATNGDDGVNAWIDQSAGRWAVIQNTVASRPSFQPAGGPNGRPSILFNGTSSRLVNNLLNRPPPGTTRTVVWQVFRLVTWTITRRIFGFGNASMSGITAGATPQIGQSNGATVNLNGALALNTYARGEFGFSNSTADYVKLAATTVTGANALNTDPIVGFTIGAGSSTSTDFTNIELCELAIFSAFPSAPQTALLDAYVTALYGPGLV